MGFLLDSSYAIRVEHESIKKLTLVKFHDRKSVFDSKGLVTQCILDLRAKDGIFESDYKFSCHVIPHQLPGSEYDMISVHCMMGIEGRCCIESDNNPAGLGLLVYGHTRSCQTRMTSMGKNYLERIKSIKRIMRVGDTFKMIGCSVGEITKVLEQGFTYRNVDEDGCCVGTDVYISKDEFYWWVKHD